MSGYLILTLFSPYFQSALPGYHLSLNRFTQYKNTLLFPGDITSLSEHSKQA